MKSKKLNLIVLISIILVGILLAIPILKNADFGKATTDSGFDSSWDSGGIDSGGGGFDWDSGGGTGSYEMTPGEGLVGLSIFGFVFICIVLACLWGFLSSDGSKGNVSYNNDRKLLETTRALSPEEIELLKKYGFTMNRVRNDAYHIYVDIQKAWSKNHIEEAKDLLSNELFNTYKSEIEVMKAKHERNEMSDFQYLDSAVSSVKEENNDTLSVSVLLRVSCKDYLVDMNNSYVKRGDSNRINYYYYRLSFIIPGTHHYFDTCPNCSAPLPKEEVNIKCEYCGSKIVRKLNKMILTRKEMIEQK